MDNRLGYDSRSQGRGSGVAIPAIAFAVIAMLVLSCGDGAVEPAPPDPPRPTSVTVTPAMAELTALGATTRLSAEVRDQNRRVMAGAAVAWSSSNASVASVDASGLVTAAGNGAATITATSGTASGAAAVTVAQVVSAVAMAPAADTVLVADTVRLSAEALDANGHAVAGAELSWASADTLVAVVDTEGLVMAVAAGEAEITATSSGVTGRAALIVAAAVPTTVAVTPDTIAFTAVGQTMRLAAEVRDQIGRPMEDVAVYWTSGDTLVATVDSAGLVTAAGRGTATIMANAGDATGTAVVSVTQSAASVTVSPTADTIAPGDTLRLVAEAFDVNGHRVADAEFAWASSDVSVVRVDDSGFLTGVGEGMATVTATVGAVSGTAAITVANPDRAVLVAFYEATAGPNWMDDTNWLTDAPLREWYGVETDASGRVVRLDLSGRWDRQRQQNIKHGLRGPIPPELGSLANLVVLNLLGNYLTGEIPPELGELVNLEALILNGNGLTGEIPTELGRLVNLRTLNLSGLEVMGPIPASFLQLERLSLFYAQKSGICVPGTSAFAAWLQQIQSVNYLPPYCNSVDAAALEALYHAAEGTGWTNAEGWLNGNTLEEWYGVESDSLGRVTGLDLSANGLDGELPPTLVPGALNRMSVLRIGGNALGGRLPLWLTRTPLREFRYAETTLCAPADTSVKAWLRSIQTLETTGLECTPLSERSVLEILYKATNGPDWSNRAGWMTDAPLAEWHGVSTSGAGKVTHVDLDRNGLAGPVPPELGELTGLVQLSLASNDLVGPIPPEIGNIGNLVELNISENDLTGPIPSELGKLANLERLVLQNNALTGEIPPELGKLSNLRTLSVWSNALVGPIPPELGRLASLEYLAFSYNALTGEIPPELGDLGNLGFLSFYGNRLTGSIPPELGKLSNLTRLYVNRNELTGPIPSEFGNLVSLEGLYANTNKLTGAIPNELGRLANLKWLYLDANKLTGPLPPELGRLGSLVVLVLTDNRLTGSVPPEFGAMTRLRDMFLSHNPGLKGVLPLELTGLSQLETLVADGTGICTPADPDFQNWLARVNKSRVKACTVEPPIVYVTQAVQSLEFPVPLVAGERALVRVFLTANTANDAVIPGARARFYASGEQIHAVDIPAKSGPIPTEVNEGHLAMSVNAEIPETVVRPGLEMVIEVDAVDGGLGVPRRIPETGRLAVEVREMPPFDLTLIPFIWTQTHDSAVVDLIEAVATDPERHELLHDTRTLLPVADLTVTAHDPVLSSSNNSGNLLRQATAIRALERGQGHYMGMMNDSVSGPSGIAPIRGRVSFSVPGSVIMAHELGHSLSLRHAPCGNAGDPDPGYPYVDGSIGAWGYDFRDGGKLVQPDHARDLMTYCGTRWISDYHFTNALRFRLRDEGARTNRDHGPSGEALLLWGGTDADGAPFLEPAFVVDAPAALPDSSGAHVVTGRTASGGELFSLAFTMPEVADGDGSSSFAFALPVRPGWETNLATVTLSGPGGTVTLDEDSNIPMAILRDPRSGQVRGFLRGLPTATQAAADTEITAARGLEVLFSRGIPGADAWRR